VRPQLALSCIPRVARIALPREGAVVSHPPLRLAVSYHPRFATVAPLDEVAEPIVDAWPTALRAGSSAGQLFCVDGTLMLTTTRVIGIGVVGTSWLGAIGAPESALLLSADRSEITSVNSVGPEAVSVAFVGGLHRLVISQGPAARTLLAVARRGATHTA